MDKDKLWQSVLAQLQLTLSRPVYSIWFAKTFIKSCKKIADRQIIEIGVQNSFAQEKLELNYLGQIKEILDTISGEKNEIRFVIADREPADKPPISGPLFDFNPEKEFKESFLRALSKARLNRNYTFQNFAVAPSNEVAYAAATAVAKKPGEVYNPLFLYGGVGVGKTHLMQAIGIEVLKKHPETAILYSTSEEFVNEIIQAIRNKNTASFKSKFRNVQLLLVDDIQFIAGKDAVQEEFFHTFNTIKQQGGQMVLTSDKMPEEIKGLEDRLKSRFEGGLMIDVQEPNFELRTAILLIKAKQIGENIPLEAAKLIAQKIHSTRKLEGFLARLTSEKILTKKDIDLEMVERLLPKFSSQAVAVNKRILPEDIIKATALFYNIKYSDIRGKRRLKQVVFPRQVAIFLLREELKLTHQEIGNIFGGKDHTTIMHSFNKINNLISSSQQLKEEIENIKKRLF